MTMIKIKMSIPPSLPQSPMSPKSRKLHQNQTKVTSFGGTTTHYVLQLSQFSSEFYSLVYDDHQEDLQQAHDDGEVREQLLQHRRSECLLSPLLDPGDGLGLQSDDCRSTKPVQLVDNLIQNVLSTISAAAPSNIYRNKWKEEKIDSFINPEFREIWRNSLIIFCHEEEKEVVPILPPPPQTIRYPTIDITKCNIRSLANVPKPQKYPILGCSDDPNFYVLSHSCYQPTGGYYKCSPYGEVYGYQTNLGIVPVPDVPVYGYVWVCQEKPRPLFQAQGSEEKGVALHYIQPSMYCLYKHL